MVLTKNSEHIYIYIYIHTHTHSDTSANEDIFAVFWTRLTNMDSANECFSGCAL